MARRPSPKQRRLVILLLTVLTFGLAYYAGNQYSDRELPTISGILIRPMIPVPEFELRDQDGGPFSHTDLTGHWSLLVFDPSSRIDSPAYRRLIQVHNRLASEPALQRNSRFIYIPRQRDAEIDVSVTRLGANILALHGEPSTISDISQRFGIEETQEIFILYLIDPDAKIRALFTHTQDAATIANDFTSFIANQR